MEGVKFTEMEIEKLIVIQSVIDGKRTGKEASDKLNLSERQIWRLVKKVKENGIEGIKHGNSFIKKPRFLTNQLKEHIINLKLSDNYCDTNFTHFKELLEERENIKLSYTSLYKILSEYGIKSKKKHKDRKIHRQRKRKSHEGDLVQADGTPFDWFKDGHMYSIHGFIDDATGKVLGAYMCEHECLLGYLEVLRQMLKNYGIPKCLYPDKFSVFFPSGKQKLTIQEQLQGKEKPTTQFKRIIDVLGIDMFPASTSQAKGRIERLWNTFQDRLITEFKLANITTIDDANKFLINYLKRYNKRFAVEAESPESNFIPVPSYLDLDLLLAIKINRTIDSSGSFSINNKKFQILNNNIMPKSKINIYISKKIGIIAEHNNTKYKVICSDNLPSKYSTLNMNQFYKDHYQELYSFAMNLLTYNAKEKEPLLISS